MLVGGGGGGVGEAFCNLSRSEYLRAGDFCYVSHAIPSAGDGRESPIGIIFFPLLSILSLSFPCVGSSPPPFSYQPLPLLMSPLSKPYDLNVLHLIPALFICIVTCLKRVPHVRLSN